MRCLFEFLIQIVSCSSAANVCYNTCKVYILNRPTNRIPEPSYRRANSYPQCITYHADWQSEFDQQSTQCLDNAD